MLAAVLTELVIVLAVSVLWQLLEVAGSGMLPPFSLCVDKPRKLLCIIDRLIFKWKTIDYETEPLGDVQFVLVNAEAGQ